jgi:hypothetical protein
MDSTVVGLWLGLSIGETATLAMYWIRIEVLLNRPKRSIATTEHVSTAPVAEGDLHRSPVPSVAVATTAAPIESPSRV